ncbi:hypothetical protein Tco_1501316 [Tanacetum coccineum]
MDDPNIMMEEYIQLMADKARGRDQTFNWETATYGEVYCDDSDLFTDFETNFPAIVYNDASTSNQNVSSEPTISVQRKIPNTKSTPEIYQSQDKVRNEPQDHRKTLVIFAQPNTHSIEVNDFVPMDIDSSGKKAEYSKRRPRAVLGEESVKRQKVDDDAEKAELKAYLEIVPNDDSLFSAMLDDFDRQDVLDLYRIEREDEGFQSSESLSESPELLEKKEAKG